MMELSDDATFRDVERMIELAVEAGRLSVEEGEELRRKIRELEERVGNRTKQGLPAEPYHSSAVSRYREASEKVLNPKEVGIALAKARVSARRRLGRDVPSVLDGIFKKMEEGECPASKENQLTLFVLEEVEKGASALEIINKGAERGYDALRVAEKICELLREGHIYEPRKGELRIVG